MGRNVRIGRIAGIPVGISPWWLAIVVLLTWSLRSQYDQLAPAAASALAFASVLCVFAGILAHEFGHALVARRAGIEIEEIDLWLLGGVARMRSQPQRAQDELRFALAGPAVTVVLALAFGAATLLTPAGTLHTFVAYQAMVNAAIAAFNMLPALPLDGGRVARALLWRHNGDFRRATAIAARAGRWTGYGMVYFGVLATLGGFVGGLWLAMIGVFLVAAATAEQRLAELQSALAGATVAELMSAPAVVLERTTPLEDALDTVRSTRFTAYPVVDADGVLVGQLQARRLATAASVADAFEAPVTTTPDDQAATLLDRAEFLARGRAVVVDDERRPLGMVSVTDMERRVRASRNLAASSRHGPAGVQR